MTEITNPIEDALSAARLTPSDDVSRTILSSRAWAPVSEFDHVLVDLLSARDIVQGIVGTALPGLVVAAREDLVASIGAAPIVADLTAWSRAEGNTTPSVQVVAIPEALCSGTSFEDSVLVYASHSVATGVWIQGVA